VTAEFLVIRGRPTISLGQYCTCIYNVHTFSSGTESEALRGNFIEALAVIGEQYGKGVVGLFEKVSFQTAFEGVESG